MPKKSKKSNSGDSDLPDLETRRAYLLAIGMPSPYRGGSTTSSSTDESSSSSSTSQEASNNTGRQETADNGASTIYLQCTSEGNIRRDDTGKSESVTDSEITSQNEKVARPVTVTPSSDPTPGSCEVKKEENVSEENSTLTPITFHTGDVSRAEGTSTAVVSVSPDLCFKTPSSGQITASSTIFARPREGSTFEKTSHAPSDHENIERIADNSKILMVHSRYSPEKAQSVKTRRDKSPVVPAENETSVERQQKKLKCAAREDKKTETAIERTQCTSSKEKGGQIVKPTELSMQVSKEARGNTGTQIRQTSQVSAGAKERESIGTSSTKIQSKKRARTLSPISHTTKISSKRRTRSETPTKNKTDILPKKGKRTLQRSSESSSGASREYAGIEQRLMKYPTDVSRQECPKARNLRKRTPDKTEEDKSEKTAASSSLKVSSKERKRKSSEHMPPPEKEESLSPSKRGSKVSPKAAIGSVKIKHEASPITSQLTVVAAKIRKQDVSSVRNTSVSGRIMPRVSSTRTAQTTLQDVSLIGPAEPSESKLEVSSTESSGASAKRLLGISPREERYEARTKFKQAQSTNDKGARPKTQIRISQIASHEETSTKQETSPKRPVTTSGSTEPVSGKYTRSVPKEHGSKDKCPIEHSKECTHESGMASESERLRYGLSQASTGNEYMEHNLISFEEFKEALGVDRLPDRKSVYPALESCADHTQPIHQMTPEEFLEALDKLGFGPQSSDNNRTDTKESPEKGDELLTAEEFRRALGTDQIPPLSEDFFEVFDKALEKWEAKKHRRVTFLLPGEPVPSTSRTRTSPERLPNETTSPNVKSSDSSRNSNLFSCNLAFGDIYTRLRSPSQHNPDFFNMKAFVRAIESIEEQQSSGPAQQDQAKQFKSSDESDSSDEDINRAIAESGLKLKRSQVILSDDEPTWKSSPTNITRQSQAKLKESPLCAKRITDEKQEHIHLSETSESPEATPEEHHRASPERGVLSSESFIRSSGSKISRESKEKLKERSPIKATVLSRGKLTSVSKVSRESESKSGIETSSSVTKPLARGNESTGSSEESEMMSPKKRQKRDETTSVEKKPTCKQPRRRSKSEGDLRKRLSSDKDSSPRKKRYSDGN